MASLAHPETVEVNRSQLRQNQSRVFREARGSKVVAVKGRHPEDEKYVVDKKYFDELLRRLRAALETLEITADARLFQQILKAGKTVDDDLRRGHLYSFEEAFGQE
jgi:hypothetical protein